MEGTGLRVNMGKTKILMSGPGLDVLQRSGEDPHGVCLKGVDANSILYGGYSSWIHKKCSGIPGSLKPDPSFRGKRCTGQDRPIDERLMTDKGHSGSGEAWVMPCFRYLGDCLSSCGGCELATITRCHLAWGKFNELLSVLTSRSFPITSKWRVHNSCVKSAKAPCKRNLGPI